MKRLDTGCSLLGASVIALLLSGSAGHASAAPTIAPASPTVEVPAAHAHPEVLADVGWLAAHLDDPTVRIVDARMPFEAALYPTGHIPGAVFLDVFEDLCCPSSLMSAGAFATLAGTLGIGDDTTVVAYDSDGGQWAARLWWALRYYGHDRVMVLDGGLRQWVASRLPLETAAPEVVPAVFTPQAQPRWRATIEEVRAAIDDPAVDLVDALPWPSYTGDAADFGVGHIPTSVSLPVLDTIDGIAMTIVAPDVLSRMLMRLGLDPAKRVITYCGGGYAGAHDAFVLYLMGFDQVGLYDGSLLEWTSDPSNPMETVP